MEVGDYVRTKWRITKITSLNTYCNLVVETESGDIDKDKIIKSSPNIIDLIEVGDYVNGSMVVNKIDDKILITQLMLPYDLKEQDIKRVVTHEQFSQMEYRIGE